MMNVSPQAQVLLHSYLNEFRREVIYDHGTNDKRDWRDRVDQTGLFWTTYYFEDESVIGITGQGTILLDALSREIRSKDRVVKQTIGHSELMNAIHEVVATEWHAALKGLTSEQDALSKLSTALSMIVLQEQKAAFHFIPLRLFHEGGSPFQIGPVRFTQVCDFDPSWVGAVEGAGIATTKQIAKLCDDYEADWIAIVEVPDRERTLSALAANQATDIALLGPKLMFADSSFTKAARLNGLSRPRRHSTFTFSDGRVLTSFGNDMPGLGWSRPIFDGAIRDAAAIFASIGRRLSGFLQRASPIATLDHAWCDAAYWFHEALQADLDTIAIVKFETSIEILLRAESSSGSNQRILRSFEAFFGSKPDDRIDGSLRFSSVRKFAETLVGIRSRVLHGTLSTIHNDVVMSRSEIRHLCRSLLLHYTVELDSFTEAAAITGCEPIDKVDAFMDWVIEKRAGRSSTSQS